MAFTRLRYHIVFATKNRTRWIWPDIEGFLYRILVRQANQLGAHIVCIGGIQDHVHLVCAIPAHMRVEDMVRDLKSDSSSAVRREFAGLYGFKWQQGFGAFTLNPFDMDAIIHYVENQKAHHENDDLRKLWERVDAM